MPQSQTAANHQEEEKNEKNLHVQNKQTNVQEAHRPVPPFPKRGDHNAKRKKSTRRL